LYSYKDQHLYNFNEEDGLTSDDIYCMELCSNGYIWLGTDRGLNICTWNENQKSIVHHGTSSGIPDEIILSIYRDNNDQVWIGTHDHGFGLFNPDQKRYTTPFLDWNYGPINKIVSHSNHKLFIGTENEGLFSFDLSRGALENISGYFPHGPQTVSDLVIDGQKNLWVAQNQSYLYLVNDYFQFIDLEMDLIQAICLEDNNAIWIGTSNGLYKKELNRGNTSTQKHLAEKKLNIISLDIDAQNQLWIGTFGQGLLCYNPKNQKWLGINEASGLLNNSVLSITCQPNEVWVASLGGASQIKYEGNIFSGTPSISNQIEGLGSSYIYHIFIDSKNRKWFGTDGQGLSVLEKNEIVNFTESEKGRSFKTVYSITEDPSHKIWFINNEGQVFYQNKDQFLFFDRLEPGLDLAGISCNQSGEIVISHREGLLLIHPETFHITHLSEEFDLSDLQPNLNTMVTDHQGNTWIGSKNRLINYRVGGETSNYSPKTLITQVSLFDEPLYQDAPYVFRPKENFLSFHFVGISYLTPQKTQYRYMLEGYERHWNTTRDQRVSYSHLPSGNYIFMVQSSFSDQFEQQPIQTFAFQIKKAIYDRAGFWVIAVLIGYLMLYLLGKSRERKLQEVAKRKREQIEFQYHQLQSQINPHFLFNSYNTLLNIIEEKPEIAAEYVEKLSDFYRQILTLKEKDMVTLDEEIRLVQDYFYLLQKRYGNHLLLEIDVHSRFKYVAPLSLQMLVENAVKHNVISKKYPLKISINEKEDRIIIRNNLQPKMHTERSTGFGLKNIKERYAILNNSPVEIEQSETEFMVSIPFVKNILIA
jgi:ligand-binding sensor domain-containing protein